MVSKQPKEFLSRRKFAATFSSAVLAGFAGCSGGSGGGDGGDGGEATATDTPEPTATATATTTPTSTPTEEADAVIEVGPDGSYFDYVPERVRISAGDTVRWEFKSGGHNICAHPSHHSDVSLPEGAEPFGSHPEGNPQGINPQGATYTHTFDTTGDYTYVCILHVNNDMIGHLTVR
ncbi:plastocyanin/azurin family copper-binding protein [Haloplanus pelagicus]|jgi:plastocyanin|uniref:plastocyanin/azurin family copper-binding protein n=1 Tax=Haloplanus pelagicus TaxID=2949995 RepID=UPI00204180E9|nr:plastocyanin/azurin family copper-binding protein [Haloplanus sp. HW8-1]